MIEVFDIKGVEFLRDLEFTQQKYDYSHKDTAKRLLHDAYLKDKKISEKILSNYNHIYKDWFRWHDLRFIFRFVPNKPTMLPHQDFTSDAIEEINGKVKRILIYLNYEWNTEYGGGTYFSEAKNYKPTRLNTPSGTNKRKFMQEATLIENKPGRAVIFDAGDWHIPEEFSGNHTERLVFGSAFIHPDELSLVERLVVPNFAAGGHIIKLK